MKTSLICPNLWILSKHYNCQQKEVVNSSVPLHQPAEREISYQ